MTDTMTVSMSDTVSESVTDRHGKAPTFNQTDCIAHQIDCIDAESSRFVARPDEHFLRNRLGDARIPDAVEHTAPPGNLDPAGADRLHVAVSHRAAFRAAERPTVLAFQHATEAVRAGVVGQLPEHRLLPRLEVNTARLGCHQHGRQSRSIDAASKVAAASTAC